MGTDDYTRLRGESVGAEEETENKLVRYFLPLDALDEETASYTASNGLHISIGRGTYEINGRPTHVTLILGEEMDGEAEAT